MRTRLALSAEPPDVALIQRRKPTRPVARTSRGCMATRLPLVGATERHKLIHRTATPVAQPEIDGFETVKAHAKFAGDSRRIVAGFDDVGSHDG